MLTISNHNKIMCWLNPYHRMSNLWTTYPWPINATKVNINHQSFFYDTKLPSSHLDVGWQPSRTLGSFCIHVYIYVHRTISDILMFIYIYMYKNICINCHNLPCSDTYIYIVIYIYTYIHMHGIIHALYIGCYLCVINHQSLAPLQRQIQLSLSLPDLLLIGGHTVRVSFLGWWTTWK